MAGANRLYWPRRGSLQFWPRKRAKHHLARARTWPANTAPKLLGYIGYKAGMTHVQFTDNRPNTMTKGLIITMPVTIIECPSLLPLSLVFYKKVNTTTNRVAEIFTEKLPKSIKKPKSQQKEPSIQEFDELRLKVITQPKLTSIGKKNYGILEIAIGGPKQAALTHARELLHQDHIKISDIFKEGQFIDVHAVTKGKGFQGTIKRYGVKIRQHKSEKVKRGVGTLGPWTPKRVRWSVGQPGKMGYHTRTEYNKHLIKINTNPAEINPKGGFVRYGLVKNEYILVKGSIPGSKKRPVLLTEPLRAKQHAHQIAIAYTNQESQQ